MFSYIYYLDLCIFCYFSKYISFIFKYLFADIITYEEDRLLHTLQTLGHLSNKAARRVYFNIIHHVNTIDKDGLVKAYIYNLVEFLRLTKFLHTVNEKSPVNGEKTEEPQYDEKKNE